MGSSIADRYGSCTRAAINLRRPSDLTTGRLDVVESASTLILGVGAMHSLRADAVVPAELVLLHLLYRVCSYEPG